MTAVEDYVMLALVIAAIGAWGILRARNALRILISVELLINAANILFVAFAANGANTLLGTNANGQVIVLFTIALAAAEAAVGLAIFIQLFRRTGSVALRDAMQLRW